MKKEKNKKIFSFQSVKSFFSSFSLTNTLTALKKGFVNFFRYLSLIYKKPSAFLKITLSFAFKWWKRLLITFLILIFVLYPIIAWQSEKIDVNPHFRGTKVKAPASQAVETAKELIDREVSDYGWKANLPYLFPSAMLDNMPAFQQGIIHALAEFSFVLNAPQAQKAASLLSLPGDVWYVNFSSYLKPSIPSNRSYRKARRLLKAYNRDLSRGAQRWDASAEKLTDILSQIAADMAESIDIVEQRVDKSPLLDLKADNLFYFMKGQGYAYALLLRDLQKDFETCVITPEIEGAFEDVLYAFNRLYRYQPAWIINGKPDGFLPSHLMVQAFYATDAVLALQKLIHEIKDTKQ